MLRIFLLGSLLISLRAFGQVPSFETVLTYLHENVDVNPTNGIFELAKKPDGFFVYTTLYSEDQERRVIDYQLLWNARTNKFVQPVFSDNSNYIDNEEESMPLRFSLLWQRRQSMVPMIYYGYTEWIQDTKKFVEKKSDPTNHELESLARAYFAEANSFIHPNQYGFEGGQDNAYEDAGYERISEERVMGFKRSFDKSIAIWEQIRTNDPAYAPNFILDINLKIGNEYMHGFLTMNCIKEPELAEEYLEKASYPPSFIVYAKQFLNECDSNAILLTNGDSDTYPFWFVQEKLGYRKDVTVVNISLAQTTWYRELLMDRYQLKSGISPEISKDVHLKYFIFQGENRLPFTEWLTTYGEPNTLAEEMGMENPNYIFIDGEWDLNYGNNSISVKNKQYTFAFETFLYSVINSNPNRKIFASSYYSFIELGLKEYGSYFGQLYRLEETEQVNDVHASFDNRVTKIIQELPNDYFSGLGNWGFLRRSLLLFTCSKVSAESMNSLMPIVEQKIINDVPVLELDPELAYTISVFYAKFLPAKQKKFNAEYDKAAVKFVSDFKANPANLYGELENMDKIISMYSGFSVNEFRNLSNDECKWEGSQTLQKALIAKLSELTTFCNKEGMNESAKKISSILKIVKSCSVG